MAETAHDMSRRWWRVAFALCSAAAALPLLTTFRLPMADLPQHAVQLTVWKFLQHPCYRFSDFYEINWLTPYLLGTFGMHLLAAVMPVQAALKVAIYATVIALPLVLRRITDFAGIDPWFALLGFPLSFGFTFYWGFVNFNILIPAVILLLLYCCRVSRQTAGPLLATAVSALFIAVSHALAYGFAVVVAFPTLVVRRLWWHAAAILAPAPLLAAWVLRSRLQERRAQAPWDWRLSPGRIWELLDFLLSAGRDADAFWFAAILIVSALLLGVRFAPAWWRWIPLIAATGGFLLMPYGALGQTLLYPRLLTIIPAAALIALEPRPPLLRRGLARLLLTIVVLTWMAVLSARFHRFGRDADGFDRLVDAMPPNQRVLLFPIVQSSEITGPPFLHWSGYYLERKGGVIGWSFASNFPTVVRYRSGFNPGVPPTVTRDPRFFAWKQDGHFDYFIVRAPVDLAPLIFRDAAGAVLLRRRAGLWWLYENRQHADRPSCPPLERDGGHPPLLNPRW